MREGVVDDVDGETYPDPLTLNYSSFIPSQFIESLTLLENDLARPWVLFSRKYGQAIYDDVILSLNEVPHRNFLTVDQELFFPDIGDLVNAFRLEERR